MSRYFIANTKSEVRLGQELGRGGEGAVYPVEGQPNRVAKIYNTLPDDAKARKLSKMPFQASPELLAVAAWPTDLLANPNGRTVGFLMPRFTSRRDAHELYGPKSRADAFPQADFRFVSHVAANICRAFALVHSKGHVIGDINHGNVLVGLDGTIVLIDCDSFQIRSDSGFFSCDVGVPLFTAPELQNRAFRGLERTQNHDAFGLAVLLFHLFYMGRHPFAGRYTGSGEMPIEKAIAERRFVYGPGAAAYGMERPPGTLPLEVMGGEISTLFNDSLGRNAEKNVRPDARRWLTAVEKLEKSLRSCSKVSSHHFSSELTECPWCSVESRTGVRLFGQRVISSPTGGTIDVAALWNSIVAVPGPGPAPPLPSERPIQASQAGAKRGGGVRTFRKLCAAILLCLALYSCGALAKSGGGLWAVASVICAIWIWPRVPDGEKRAADNVVNAARNEWNSLVSRWEKEAVDEIFKKKMGELEAAKRDIQNIAAERAKRIHRLTADQHKIQKEKYLDRFRIDRAKIKGIGPSRTSMLASYGIETAADISKSEIQKIPGFGQSLTSELVSWRAEHERNFQFNPSTPIDPKDIQQIDADLDALRKKLLVQLQAGRHEIMKVSQEVSAARQRLIPALENAWIRLKSAEADRDALS